MAVCYVRAVYRFNTLVALCPILLGVGQACSGDRPARTPLLAESDAKPPSLQRCSAPARPSAAIRLAPMFDNLEIRAPVGLVQAPAKSGQPSGRWFLLDQHGYVHSFFESDGGHAVKHQVSDLTDRVYIDQRWMGELGLLGIALHPRFPDDSRVFLAYTASDDSLEMRIVSFDAREGRLDLASETILLRAAQPYKNHNGGHIAFGPDGHLYIGLGDGGAGGDPHGHGQNTQTLLGTILRIDIDRPSTTLPYGIVADNPFAEGGGRPEIYAYGLRNPWRFSFDRVTGELWSGDVGQETWEEINRIERGGNYGWNEREGSECFPPGESGCLTQAVQDPVYAYRHPNGAPRSVTGGFVYRGAHLPHLVGHFVFADFETGSISALKPAFSPSEPAIAVPLVRGGFQASAFAEDAAGELYVLDYGGNRVLRLEPGRSHQSSLPRLLSQTGCVEPQQPAKLGAGAIPYEVAVPFWSDGADKQRHLFLPAGASLTPLADGDIEVPRGTVLVKTFSYQGQPFETRFYVRHRDGEYSGYSYAWRADGRDAELVEETRIGHVGNMDWVYPGPEACNQCHTAPAGRTLGLELRQLALQEGSRSQLDRLKQVGALAHVPTSVTAFSNHGAGSLRSQARAYLHVNCSNCHRPKGPGRGTLDLRFDTPLAETGLCEPSTLTPGADLLLPGTSARSALVQRMSTRDSQAMPPLASLHVDTKGASLIARWIDSLESCPSLAFATDHR